MARATLLIVEPHSSGHRGSYLRWLVEGALKQGAEVLVASTTEAQRNPLMADLFDLPGQSVTFVELPRLYEPTATKTPSKIRLLLRELAYYYSFRSMYRTLTRRRTVSGVIVPYVDYCFHVIALLGSPFGSAQWCGITMRSGGGRGSFLSRVRGVLLPRFLRIETLRVLFSINTQRPISAGADPKLRFLRDPAELRMHVARQEARASLGLSDGACVLLVIGTIDERKGVKELLAAMELMDRAVWQVLIAGTQSESIRQLFAAAPYRGWVEAGFIRVVDAFLEDADFCAAVAAADVVWLGYVGHLHSSGVMVVAGVAGLPIVACAAGEIGIAARRWGLGPAVDVSDPQKVADALRCLQDDGTRRRYGSCGTTAFVDHTPAAFSRDVLSSLS